MKHRERFGYMILGAVIMLVGLGIGALVSAPLRAQTSFGEITCTGLTVTDESGKPVIMLQISQEGGAISVTNKKRNAVAILTTEEKLPALYLVNIETNAKAIVSVDKHGGGASFTGATGDVNLSVTEYGGGLLVKDSDGTGSIFLHVSEGKGKIDIND